MMKTKFQAKEILQTLAGAIAVVILALCISVFLPKAANAGLWEKLSGALAKTVPSKMFAIEAQGNNLRAYAFTLESEGKTCIAVASSKGLGLDCWDSK